jgi:hypothetical protein
MEACWKTALEEAQGEARSQLGEVARDLEAVRFRLRGVEASLPPAPLETIDLLEEEMDARSELRAVIQHVVTELVAPAVQALRTAAEFRKEET